MPTYYIRTFGCQMNEHDSERLASALEASGFVRAEREAEADVIVYNTCAVRENAAERLYGNLGWARLVKKRRPGVKVAVGGCLAELEGARLQARAPHVDVVFGTRNGARLPELLRQAERGKVLDLSPDAPVLDLGPRRARRFSAWVAISTGCDASCTFCIVPRVRGPERSRPPEEVLGEVRKAVAEGAVEVTLLGQNVNSYGLDLEGRRLFGRLLLLLEEVEGLERVRFTSPNPKDFDEAAIEALARAEKVCEQVHLPLQSGSDRILRLMRRGYRRAGYLGLVKALREALPGLALTTDVIVGFPGETEEDFEATLELVREVGFDSCFTFRFSPRPGTPAAEMPGQVGEDVVRERFERLVRLAEEKALERNASLVGTVHEVLVEGSSWKDPSRLTGRTRTGKIVHFRAALEPGEFALVEVVGAHPHHLDGVFLSRGKLTGSREERAKGLPLPRFLEARGALAASRPWG